jgi:hypothetical protein
VKGEKMERPATRKTTKGNRGTRSTYKLEKIFRLQGYQKTNEKSIIPYYHIQGEVDEFLNDIRREL